MARGGKRPGAGRKKTQATLDKELLREELRRKVKKQFGPLIDAQIANAKGINYLVSRDPKTGKFTPVEDASQIGDATEIWLKQPNVQAFTDLMNRAIDKPAEQPQEVQVSGGIELTWKDSE